ncbi:ABC transporter substrate-binding protein [Tianweitania sp.]|uniref:ABC transporter substrate-binding protein n=1 Tax=Tianweitania sp. TaxID=2021634 RepID=UPI00289809D1|nr:ABC transporter substrate-binding protein [Tianweitania sp.]
MVTLIHHRQIDCVALHRAAQFARLIAAFALSLLLAVFSTGMARAEPVTVTDIMGRQVSLDAPAKRIILGAGRHLPVLGLIHYDPASLLVGWRDDFRRDVATFEAWASKFPRLADLPVVGGPAGSGLDVETVVALEPDLVILSLYDAEALDSARSIEMLERLGIPVLVLDFFSQPLKNSRPSLRMLGQVLGTSEKAEAFIAFYDRHMKAIADGLAVAPFERPSVFMHVHAGGTPCCASPGHGIFNDMIELAGGRNLALDYIPGLYGDVSVEQLLVDDPQIYIATGGAYQAARGGLVLGPGIPEADARASFEGLLREGPLAQLTTIREGRAQALWQMFNDTPIHIVMIERLAKLFHPDRFPDLDPQATLDQINRDFLTVPMTGTLWLDQ